MEVRELDETYGLTLLTFEGGELILPSLKGAIGSRIRVVIHARDVSLTAVRGWCAAVLLLKS